MVTCPVEFLWFLGLLGFIMFDYCRLEDSLDRRRSLYVTKVVGVS